MRIKIKPQQNTFEQTWKQVNKTIERLEILSEKDLEAREREREDSKKIREELKESIKAMQKELGGISNSNGEMAESYFINSLTNKMQFAGQEYDDFIPKLKKKKKKLNLQGEYDLVMYNCKSIAIIEIKYKAREKDLEKLVLKAPIFKQLFPEYANYNIYLGLAALHFEAETEKESLVQGVAVIKQIGDSMVIYDAHLKVF